MHKLKSDYHILFKLVKQNKWDDLILKLKEDEYDLNIMDETGTHLIQYAVIFNKKDIVTLLISRGAKIDTVDEDNRTLLYYAIKFKYTNMLDLLLHFNNNSFGILLVDIKDNVGNTALHTSVKYNDIISTTKLLDNGANINIQNNSGLNCLMLATYNKNLDMMKLLIKYGINVNALNSLGETALHIACVLNELNLCKLLLENKADTNIQDKKNEYIPLIYSNNNISNLLIKYGSNINTQDIYGNTFLHLIVGDNDIQKYKWLIEYGPDVNIFNIFNQIPLHLIFDNKNVNLNDYIVLFEKSNLTIQNDMGNNALHLLVAIGKWKDFIPLLEKKVLDIYAINKNNKSVIDLLDNEDDKQLLLDTVCKSYMIDIKCDQINIKCDPAIKAKIIKNKISTKVSVNVNISFDQDGNGIFVGLPIDIISGLLYLLNKYPNVTSVLSDNFQNNSILQKYYNTLGQIYNTDYDYLNFEIVWSYQHIFYPNNFDNIMSAIKKYEYIIIPLRIENGGNVHANYIIYDLKKGEVERFEPSGAFHPHDFNYNHIFLDNILKKKFEQFNKKIKYYSPRDYLSKIGIQTFEIMETVFNKKVTDPEGYCALWCIWYVDMRLSNMHIDRTMLINLIVKRIRFLNISFKNVIRNYGSKITDIRDDIIKMDINDYINRISDNKTIVRINDTIKTRINENGNEIKRYTNVKDDIWNIYGHNLVFV